MSIHSRHPRPRTRGTCAAFLLSAVVVAVPRVAAGQINDKVTICHIPPGNPANLHEIVVGAAAVPAHLAHGDFLTGSCMCSSQEGALCGVPNQPPCCGGLNCVGGTCEPAGLAGMPLGGACTSEGQCGLNQCVFLGPDDGVCGG